MFSYYAFPPRVKQCLANTVLLTKRLHREPALLMLRNQLLPIFQSTDRCFAAHLSNIRFLAPFRHWGLQAAYGLPRIRRFRGQELADADRAREYLRDYFRGVRVVGHSEPSIDVYWGTAADFLKELRQRLLQSGELKAGDCGGSTRWVGLARR